MTRQGFNPRSRAGRPLSPCESRFRVQVSIHAPARGDHFVLYRHAPPSSFNPRPRAGGDSASSHQSPPNVCFNPRPRAGGDIRPSGYRSLKSGFNPRPRAGGDSFCLLRSRLWTGFNPRPRAAGDAPMGRADVHWYTSFNPRPARAGDYTRDEWSAETARFNPRPRAGGDTLSGLQGGPIQVSIHAPGRGATSCHGRKLVGRSVSIHAPARATLGVTVITGCVAGFNPRPRAGGDTSAGCLARCRVGFRSTHPRGGRPREGV